MTKQPIFRFAPSPNGELHLGHAYSALVTDHLARLHGGRFLLRIEDVDGGRARPEYERQIFDDLRWLNLQWEEPVWKQSQHMDNYATALKKLDQMGLLYPCFASRSEIAKYNEKRNLDLLSTPDGYPVYPNIYRDFPLKEARRRIEAGNPHTLRLNMPKAMQMALQRVERVSFQERQSDGSYKQIYESPDVWGDVVLARKDIPTSYTLAVVVDDALQGITHITRGEDLYHATSLQRLLQILLDLPEPLYFHHPLIVDMTGRKLAKSDDDVSLKTIRATGISPQDLRTQLPPLLF